jgi:hypothetical protein
LRGNVINHFSVVKKIQSSTGGGVKEPNMLNNQLNRDTTQHITSNTIQYNTIQYNTIHKYKNNITWVTFWEGVQFRANRIRVFELERVRVVGWHHRYRASPVVVVVVTPLPLLRHVFVEIRLVQENLERRFHRIEEA